MSEILYLYGLFVKIGVFTFGGGYAMIPLFQDELVVRHQWLTPEEFANLIALAQMTPGPVGLNAATYIGYRQAGFAGAVSGTLGIMTPSLILVMIAACFFETAKKNAVMRTMLNGIRPATLGLVASAVIFFAGTSIFTAQVNSLWTGHAEDFRICLEGVVIFILTFFVHLKWKPGILWILGGSALTGCVWGLLAG